jgi:riboflavin kinase/FMN adenylyltransferase
MQTVSDISNFIPAANGCVLTIGVFDGIHLGHRAVINKAKAIAGATGRELVMLTFNPGPKEFFFGTDEGFYILTLGELEHELIPLGVDRLLLLPFDNRFRELSAVDFLRDYVRLGLNAKMLVVGADFTFGFRKEGSIELIKSLGSELGLELVTVDEVAVDDVPVRSTILRKLIREGRIEDANRLLDYEFYVIGVVGQGQGVGKALNCRTANIDWPVSKVKPKRGVYIVKALIGNVEYPAVADFGVRPTITGGDADDRLEVHLLDFDGVLEGKEIIVKFLSFIRDEEKFSSMDALAEQITDDISKARKYFKVNKSR